MIFWTRYVQASNQLGTSEGAILGGVHIFWTMSSTFFQGDKNIFRRFRRSLPPIITNLYMCPITWSSAACETWKSTAVPRSN